MSNNIDPYFQYHSYDYLASPEGKELLASLSQNIPQIKTINKALEAFTKETGSSKMETPKTQVSLGDYEPLVPKTPIINIPKQPTKETPATIFPTKNTGLFG